MSDTNTPHANRYKMRSTYVLLAGGLVVASALTACISGGVSQSPSVSQVSTPSASITTPSASVPNAAADQDTEERATRFDAALRQALGVQEYSELLSDPTLWGGYINGIRVQSANAFVTLQISPDDPSRKDLGQRAAKSISMLLPAEAVEGINFVVVEDATGVVIAQEQTSPIS